MVSANFLFEKLKCQFNKNVAIINIITATPAKKKKNSNYVTSLQNRFMSVPTHFVIKVAFVNLLSANPKKWSNTLKQFVCNLPTNCLSVFDHFMNLALKGLITVTV